MGRRRILFITLKNPGHIPGQPFREVAVHRLPMGVKEDIGHGDLHDGDGQNNDQQAAAEQGRRNKALEGPPKRPGPGPGEAHQSGASI